MTARGLYLFCLSAATAALLQGCWATPAPAQSCSSASYGHYKSYASKVYHAPSYSYSAHHAYTPHKYEVQKVVVKDYEPTYLRFLAVVPLVDLPTYSSGYAPAPAANGNSSPALTPPGAAPAGQQPAARAPNDPLMEQVMALLRTQNDALVKITQRLDRLEGQSAPANPYPPHREQPQKAKQPPAPPDDGDPTQASVRTVNQQKCAACHERGKDGDGGDFVLSEPGGKLVDLDGQQLLAVVKVLTKNTMPKLNKRATEHGITAKLTQQEIDVWAKEVNRQAGRIMRAMPPAEASKWSEYFNKKAQAFQAKRPDNDDA